MGNLANFAMTQVQGGKRKILSKGKNKSKEKAKQVVSTSANEDAFINVPL